MTKFSPSQLRAFDAAKDFSLPFVAVLGGAGTGKTFVLRRFLHDTRAIRLAPTGTAALEIRGQTIHRVLGQRWNTTKRFPKTRLLRGAEAIVIDEIGAVRADLLDELDAVMRHARNNSRPFGGCPVRAFGDFGQLPPVADDLPDRYDTPFAFSSDVWRAHPPTIRMLREVQRQDDRAFIDALADMRGGDAATITRGLDWINENRSKDPIERAVTLAPHRQTVNHINAGYMAGLPGRVTTLDAMQEGTINTQAVQAPPRMELKPGAMLVHLVNDPADASLVNGTTGTFDGMSPSGKLRLQTPAGLKLIERFTWKNMLPDENMKGKDRCIGSFTQYPVLPAAAMTIHKAQGKTLAHVNLDLDDRPMFEIHMAYVACSRATSIGGLHISRPLTWKDAIGTDRRGAMLNWWKAARVFEQGVEGRA